VIEQNKELQCLVCTICKEAVELRRRTASRPDLVALIKEQMAEEHRLLVSSFQTIPPARV
jgi:hypothetical protein